MKAVKPDTSATPTHSEAAVRILKTATCPSLSGKSKLTYQIGLVANGTGKAEIQFRVCANTGHGFFSDQPVALADIQQALDKVPSGKPVTSYALSSLYRGQSANSPGFLFAVLKQEGLVQPLKDKARCYERLDPKELMASLKALIALDGKPEVTKKPTAAVKKVPAKPSAKKKG